MTSPIRIFVVDDEEDLTDLLHYQLGKEGYRVKFTNNPFEALGMARDFSPDLIILDVMMPDLDGLQLLRMIRTDNLLQKHPSSCLRLNRVWRDRIKGLEQGGRLSFQTFRRHGIDPSHTIHPEEGIGEKNDHESRIMMGKVILDEEDYSITISGEKKEFTLTEFKLLHYFMKKGACTNPGQFASRGMEIDTDVETRTVDVHIRRVRKKIEESSSKLKQFVA